MRLSQLLYLSILLILIAGCEDIRPIWKGERALKSQGYSLYFSEPCEFKMNLDFPQESLLVLMELVISYDQKIARSSIPLFLVLEDEDHQVSEFTTTVVIKKEGEWLGMPEENGLDYTISHVAIEEFLVKKGRYSLKIYANDQQSEKVSGIVRLAARLYEQEKLEEGG